MHFQILFLCALAGVACGVPWNYQGYNYVDLDDTHVVHSKPVIDFNTATFESQSHQGYWSHPGLYSTAQQYLKPGYGSAYAPTIFLVAIPHRGDEDKVAPGITVSVPSLSILPPSKEWNPSSQLPVLGHSIEIVPLENSDSQGSAVEAKVESQEGVAVVQEEVPADGIFERIDPEGAAKGMEPEEKQEETPLMMMEQGGEDTKTSSEVFTPNVLPAETKSSAEKLGLDNLPVDGTTSGETVLETKTSMEDVDPMETKTLGGEAEEESAPTVVSTPSSQGSEEAVTAMPDQAEVAELSMKRKSQVPVSDKIQSDETLSDKVLDEDDSSVLPTGEEEEK